MTTDDLNAHERALLERLRERGLVVGMRSKWGQPALRRIERGHEPQQTRDASGRQKRFVECAYATPCPGDGLCASWVEQAFSRLGLGIVLGDARTLCDSYCPYTDTAQLKVAMICATTAHPFTPDGLAHGHVGLYIGRDTIMDAVDGSIRRVPLSLWLSAYGLMEAPRWGWLGSIGLS